MRTLSRRHKENVEKTKNKIYSNLDQAIQVLQETGTAKFVESVELHANLNIDPKYADQQLRTTVTLPHGVGKQVRIAVLTNDENYEEAKNAGADIVGNDELIEDITKGTINFDLLIATPNMMPKLAKLGRVLGPKGLMPSPKSGTVSSTLTATLTDFLTLLIYSGYPSKIVSCDSCTNFSAASNTTFLSSLKEEYGITTLDIVFLPLSLATVVWLPC